MRYLQYQIKAEPVSTSTERTTPDKYGPQDYVPRANWNRRAAHAAVVLALNTAFAFTPAPPFSESVSIDKWHPNLARPRWDLKRTQHLYPASVFGDIPRAEAPSVGAWHPASNQPRFDAKREQWKYPSLSYADVPRTELVSVDRWHPELEKPRWDLKRNQHLYPSLFFTETAVSSQVAPDLRLVRNELPRWDLQRRQWQYPSLFYADIPRAEQVSVDRWHPTIEQPRRSVVRPIFESGANNPYPIPNPVTAVPLDWLIQNADPFRAKPRVIIEASAFVYPVAVTPFDWLAQYQNPIVRRRGLIRAEMEYPGFVPVVPFDWNLVNQHSNQARLKQKRRTITEVFSPVVSQGEYIFIDKWEPQLRYRLWGLARRDYLYCGVGTEFPTPNAVFVDSWIPAQIYQRPLPIPLYWISYGEVDETIPGVHLPCILQADAVLVQPVGYDAVLVQPVGYDATLVQPVGYDAEEIACE